MLFYIIVAVLLLVLVLSYSSLVSWEVAEVIRIVSIGLLVFMFIILPVAYVNELGDLQKFKATKQTVYELRDQDNIEFEKATMARDIIEANDWLAEKQYFESNFWFGTSIPAEVLELEKIDY